MILHDFYQTLSLCWPVNWSHFWDDGLIEERELQGKGSIERAHLVKVDGDGKTKSVQSRRWIRTNISARHRSSACLICIMGHPFIYKHPRVMGPKNPTGFESTKYK